ncbi:MAG: hypothetical protein R3C26_03945 [Calditrichia bacterium]
MAAGMRYRFSPVQNMKPTAGIFTLVWQTIANILLNRESSAWRFRIRQELPSVVHCVPCSPSKFGVINLLPPAIFLSAESRPTGSLHTTPKPKTAGFRTNSIGDIFFSEFVTYW